MKVSQIVACVVLTATSAVLVSCGGGTKSQVVPPSVTDVYVAGFEVSNANINSAKYWKNGVPVVLTNGERVTSIVVSGNDVYAAGVGTGAKNFLAMYWKNGVPAALTDGIESAWVSSMFVSGTDVYIAGRVNGIAVYWKNGVKVPLSDGTEPAQAESIVVSGPDVYVAGHEYKTIFIPPSTYTHYEVAKYWKNGVSVELTDGTQPAGAFSMFISGSDVYVGGFACNTSPATCWARATYWKNAVPVALDPVDNILVTSIAVSGSNIYAVGSQNNSSISFWKNGTQLMPDGTQNARGSQVVVSGQDVYIAGGGSTGGAEVAEYWKNGVPVVLTGGTNQAFAYSIAVVTH